MKQQIDAQLEQLIDHRGLERDRQFCLDALDRCNLCGKSLSGERFVIDGEVKSTPKAAVPGGATMGQWAYMCASCFSTRGVGVAWGKGQLYERTPNEEWLLVAGFPPEEQGDA